MSYLELWATYCAKQNITFDDFARGAEILMSDLELWARRGFAELHTQVLQLRCSTTQEQR